MPFLTGSSPSPRLELLAFELRDGLALRLANAECRVRSEEFRKKIKNHSTIPHSAFSIQHSAFDILHFRKAKNFQLPQSSAYNYPLLPNLDNYERFC